MQMISIKFVFKLTARRLPGGKDSWFRRSERNGKMDGHCGPGLRRSCHFNRRGRFRPLPLIFAIGADRSFPGAPSSHFQGLSRREGLFYRSYSSGNSPKKSIKLSDLIYAQLISYFRLSTLQRLCRTPKVLCFYVKRPSSTTGSSITAVLRSCGVEVASSEGWFFLY